YNYQEWNARMRFNAAEHVGKDTRPQPHAQEELKLEPKTVVVTPPGGMMLFSAAQLHSSIPNQTGRTRFSIDFRCVHLGDLIARRGARNVDSKCTGSAINDYLRGSTLEHIPQEVQEIYMPGHPQPGEAKQRTKPTGRRPDTEGASRKVAPFLLRSVVAPVDRLGRRPDQQPVGAAGIDRLGVDPGRATDRLDGV